MTIQEYLLKNGPTLSSDIIANLKKSGLSNDAIRKRLSRVSKPIYKIKGFYKNNQTLLYHIDHLGTDLFYNNLRLSFKTSAKKYYAIIKALEYHNGYLKKEVLPTYSFSPIKNLKTHKHIDDIINDLKRLELIFDDDEYYILSNKISEGGNNNPNYYKAIELCKDVINNQFYNYTKSIGLISYEKGKFYSEFSKFQFCFTAPSYIAGITKFKNKPLPAFVVSDILIGNKNDEENVDYFINKINIIKAQTNSSFLPFLITDVLTQQAFKKLKQNGIIIGLVDKLFGNEYQELLKSLISTVTNAGTILKKNPEAYLKLLTQIEKLVDGKTNNLRGDLFELAVGYYYSNLCQSLNVGKRIRYDGGYKEIDVKASFQDKIVICECKAYKTPIDLSIVENWFSEKISFIYKAIREFEFDKELIFEFWSTSGFSEEAISFLKDKQRKLRRYKIEFYSEKEILEKANKSKATKISEIMREYFINQV